MDAVSGWAELWWADFRDNEYGIWARAGKLKIRGSTIRENRRFGIVLVCDHNDVDLGFDGDPGLNTIMWNGDNDPGTPEIDIYAPGKSVPGIIGAVGNDWEWPTYWEIEEYDITDANDGPWYLLDVRVEPGDDHKVPRLVVVKPAPSDDAAASAGEQAVAASGGESASSSVVVTDPNVNIKESSLGQIKALYK